MNVARFFFLGLFCCSGAVCSAPVDGYYVIELPFVPRAINESGQVLGMSQSRAVLYDNGAQMPLTGASGLDAYDLNDRGEVVGEARSSSGDRHAFVWRQGNLYDLGTLGGSFSHGAAINDRGWVAGTSSLADGSMRAFLHDGTRMINLNTPYSDFDLNDQPIFVGESFGQAINEAGAVAGSATDVLGPFRQAALYEKGVMRDLGVQASMGSEVVALNDRGEALIAVYCCGVLLHDAGRLLPIHPPRPPAGEDNAVGALNNLGQAVVLSSTGPINQGLWIYDDGSYAEILPRAGQIEVEMAGVVIDMNDAGDILAQALIGPQKRPGYVLLSRDPLASPIPEPATYALWVGGLLLLAGHRASGAARRAAQR